MKKFINRNILWTEFFVEHLSKINVNHVVISPGSRSTPLTFAFAKHSKIQTHITVDERTNGFLALGLAKTINEPVAIVTTSGTAAVELYPSIVEAYQQRVPLIVCTADRPGDLYNCGESQTINQNNLFGNHIRFFLNPGLPEISRAALKKFSKQIATTLSEGLLINKGPVHFNLPFTKPFEPNSFTDGILFDPKDFIRKIVDEYKLKSVSTKNDTRLFNNIVKKISQIKEGFILLGSGEFSNEFNTEITRFSELTNYPLIADGLSSIRFGKHSLKNVLTNSTAFFRSEKFREKYDPKLILHFGNAPTNKVLLDFFNYSNAEKISVNEYGDLKDPSRSVSRVIKENPIQFITHLINKLDTKIVIREDHNWIKKILQFEKTADGIKQNFLTNQKIKFEGKIPYELVKSILPNTNIMFTNSTPPRDFDFFAGKVKKKINVFSNRGASGIDGLVSVALGIDSASRDSTILVTGDLAFYYDINALQIAKNKGLAITIILVDNNGGGIFQMLPIAGYGEVFEEFFTASQNIDFKNIVKGFGADYIKIKNTAQFRDELKRKRFNRSRVLHIKTDSRLSFDLRKEYWKLVSNKIDKLINEN